MRTYLVCILMALANTCSAQLSKQEHIALVQYFKQLVEMKNVDELKKRVTYPLEREYPLPDIKNEVEFKNHFYDLFDTKLIQQIVASDPKRNWTAMGWRGIMLDQGTLWLDEAGHLIGLNYESKQEEQQRKKLIAMDRKQLPVSLRKYQKPIHILKTTTYKIRIDQINLNEYRFIAWPLHATFMDKPDMVLLGGKFKAYGSGGNHSYEFVEGIYRYECAIHVLGNSETPPVELILYKNEEIQYRQAASFIEP